MTFTQKHPQILGAKRVPDLSSGLHNGYASLMQGRRSETIRPKWIGHPVSEDFVTLIVVAMLTSMTFVLSLVG